MQSFYKIEQGKAQIGSGSFIPSGFIEYKVGNEPIELLEALEIETLEGKLRFKINEAAKYLKDTDWVKDYKTRHDLGLELIPADSSKWLVLNKRAEYIEFLKGDN